MEQDYLKLFYDQETVRNAVKNYLLATLDENALESAYTTSDVTGYKEAKQAILDTFSKLRDAYAKEKASSKENGAR